MHGLALNIKAELSHYQKIIPCGITDTNRGVCNVINSLEGMKGTTFTDHIQDQNMVIEKMTENSKFYENASDSNEITMDMVAQVLSDEFGKVLQVEMVESSMENLQELVKNYPLSDKSLLDFDITL